MPGVRMVSTYYFDCALASWLRAINTPPGVHWLRRAGRTVGALVVNPEPDESDLTALSPAALGARFDGGAAEPAADGAAAAAAAFSGTARRPLVLTFLLLLLTCLVAEAWIAREPRRIHS
jgi:hypothetical protein